MEFLGVEGKLYRLSYWMMRLMVVNFIWLLFNLPIVYVALLMLTASTMNQLYFIIIILFLLLPFLFFPANTALYAVVRKWLSGDLETNMFTLFWRAYKENYLRSLVGGIIIGVIWGVWIVNYYLSQIEFQSTISYVYLLFTIFIIGMTNFFFADSVHVNIGFWQSLKKSFLISFLFPHYTISTVGVSGVVLYILFYIHPVFFITLCGVFPAFISFYGYYHLYRRAEKAAEGKKRDNIHLNKKMSP